MKETQRIPIDSANLSVRFIRKGQDSRIAREPEEFQEIPGDVRILWSDRMSFPIAKQIIARCAPGADQFDLVEIPGFEEDEVLAAFSCRIEY